MKAAIHCLVSGRVQGVCYRAFAQREARRLGVTGWVRNLPDGRVEVTAAGPPVALEEFRRWLHRGPPQAVVREVITNTVQDDGWIEFSVR
ncbi:MAG: Acylphosphatase [Gammaproteobacteria bacterium]|nr:Acylphosphatase [Gammaproteobacteria bacterium]